MQTQTLREINRARPSRINCWLIIQFACKQNENVTFAIGSGIGAQRMLEAAPQQDGR
jgi:hypothetical protein